MSNGFGFSFGRGNDDDDNDHNKRDGNNQDPFGVFGFSTSGSGAGGLGDILNQFGQMLSGMGDSMSNQGGEPVNYDLALRIARQQMGNVAPVRSNDHQAVKEAVRLSELWLNDSTTLPTTGVEGVAWNAEDWLNNTMPQWKRMASPVAEHMNQAQLEGLPEEAREMMGPLSGMMAQMGAMNFGMQLGHSLGDLANQALTGSDFGLPVAPERTIAVLPNHVTQAAEELGVGGQEVLVYITAREAARQRLFHHVPWLVERLVSSVEEYAAGLVIDTSHIEEATRELGLDSGDPQSMQEALQRLQGMDLSPRITSRNAIAVSRLETLLALVEGWVEFVVEEALGERIPATSRLTEAWRRRRATGGSAEKAFSTVVGIEFNAPKVAAAVELWRRATVAVGYERRDQVWDHPDFLPTAEHLEAPAPFIDSLLDDSDSSNFEEEFAKLEEMLRKEDEKGDEDDTERGKDDGSQDGTEL